MRSRRYDEIIISFLVCLLFFTSSVFAQFGKVEVIFDNRLLKSNEIQELLPLKNQIVLFFTDNIFDEEYQDLQIPLHIQIMFEGASPKGATQTYMAQALFSNGLDQRYFDKGFQFIFDDAGSIFYDPIVFDPLASFLAFYANLILAGEMDPYTPKGGNRAYEAARDITLRGTASDYSRGWSERIRVEDLLSSNHGLRKVRLAVYFGLEFYLNQQPEQAINQFKEMIKGLDEVHVRYPREHYTLLFMNGHSSDIAKALEDLRQEEILRDLMILNPDNRDHYELALEVISR
jgi:hypothetical protein